MTFNLTGNLVDIAGSAIFPATIFVENGRITRILPLESMADPGAPFILPGFVDAHVHIESSMLVPSEFARLAVVHGTVATVSDPHEIANVCGMAGVEFMIENGKTVPFKFNFGAPSCVPATSFETAGARLNVAEVTALLERDDVKYLSEMMNFPGVLSDDPEVLQKIAAAHRLGKPVDGHAPGLRGEKIKKYGGAGISTDHECFTREEARDKLDHNMKILIREGSAAKNFDALIGLLHEYPDSIMFCSDDKHPDSLIAGHINQLCARAVQQGVPLYNVLKAACINPVIHYSLDVGLLREGDTADFILLKDLVRFEIVKTYINGILVAEDGVSFIDRQPVVPLNQFNCESKVPADFAVHTTETVPEINVPVIEALDGQLITNKLMLAVAVTNGMIRPDLSRDILKIAVVNRYHEAPVATAFIHNFGLKRGAIASSVAHDSHNIVVVGTSDETIARAVNLVIGARGGISAVDDHVQALVLPLPVAGLMSDNDGYRVAAAYTHIDAFAKNLGSTLASPFMSLSFMALLVIPSLKLSDMGLFDGEKFSLVNASR
ncbi:adenine deaminase [Hufsiella ginkgonis]|uniref:Adenine deaminase n=1 Tax=Hufsiella ginkgonis TaxID=2695274 RepID=A0A7K1XYX7_9SPHI|nr:adenine deaminase [Hufsiella ginkgonis]MXV15949.1 adenine deaminase [Hufsiella ginkgonis]